jgi:hypothetical protein
MKEIIIIGLNTAASKHPGINEFLEAKSTNTHIFCLQEIVGTFVQPGYPAELHRTQPFRADDGAQVNFPVISNILKKYTKNFSPHVDFLESFAPEGNMMALLPLSGFGQMVYDFDFGSFDIFSGHDRCMNVSLQWVLLRAASSLSSSEKALVVLNVHGVWEKDSKKGDTPLRLEQSSRIVKAMDYLNKRFGGCEFILTGDLNLLPDTKSIKTIEQFGLRNLIKEHNITSTRTSLYKGELRHADYVFVSKNVQVNEFKVLPEVVSDHAPLHLNFSI